MIVRITWEVVPQQLSIYLGKRDFVDHVDTVEPIDASYKSNILIVVVFTAIVFRSYYITSLCLLDPVKIPLPTQA
ncbi:hypothetical protein P7K49_038585 [Saguinus oedipus]|uniref:Uncharacterized protein n=1 Tax=Saguinus oedipus TaxID=9490 RepID=A0ABQ9TF54_SAGOE|nr:hypothetical protein P7K49_038585 [Saguinus oedipus]